MLGWSRLTADHLTLYAFDRSQQLPKGYVPVQMRVVADVVQKLQVMSIHTMNQSRGYPLQIGLTLNQDRLAGPLEQFFFQFPPSVALAV